VAEWKFFNHQEISCQLLDDKVKEFERCLPSPPKTHNTERTQLITTRYMRDGTQRKAMRKGLLANQVDIANNAKLQKDLNHQAAWVKDRVTSLTGSITTLEGESERL